MVRLERAVVASSWFPIGLSGYQSRQPFDDGGVSAFAREGRGIALFAVAGRRIGSVFQEQLHKSEVADRSGFVQGRDAVLLDGVDVGAGLDERRCELGR